VRPANVRSREHASPQRAALLEEVRRPGGSNKPRAVRPSDFRPVRYS